MERKHKMRIHYLQHVAFEDLGCIKDWIIEKGHQLSCTKFFERSKLPRINDFDLLIVMGGPMNISNENKYAWLKGEKEFIKDAIDAGKKVLGICLGAQLIANVLGAKVFPNTEKEIGWFPIQKVNSATNILTDFPTEFKVFHWHGDTFEIPANAINLFRSKACKNQGFLFGENVLGLQFHFEVTDKSLQLMIENGTDELITGKYIQSKETILSNKYLLMENNKRMFQLLDYFVTH